MAPTTPLYGTTALFDTPDALVHAVDETVKRGYTKFDAHTPYPVHGLDRRAKLTPSKLGFFAFGFGLLGTVAAVSLMTWVTTSEYPMVIGGKPFWTWPAFVPVAGLSVSQATLSLAVQDSVPVPVLLTPMLCAAAFAPPAMPLKLKAD